MGSGREARASILRAAKGLFVRFGFKKTSIEDIARAARIGKGSVYLHFRSKEEIFAEVVREASDRMLEALVTAVERAHTPADKLRDFLGAKLTTLAEIAADHHLGEEAVIELLPLAKSLRQAHVERERSLLREILREGVSSNAFAVSHLDLLESGLMTLLGALETSTLALRDFTGTRAGLDEVISVLIGGMSATPRRRDN